MGENVCKKTSENGLLSKIIQRTQNSTIRKNEQPDFKNGPNT